MEGKRKVILITDGDVYAARAVKHAAKELGGRCISMSAGNPTLLTGQEIVRQILKTPHDPVLVMFDDSGFVGEGAGERALKYVALHPKIHVLGAIAVASKTRKEEWTRTNVCIDQDGELTSNGIDKYGIQEMETGRINGDTVYCLDQLKIPIVVGIGDIGKMSKKDAIEKGSPVTKKAVLIILERSGLIDTTEKG